MRILITGATGLIGRELGKALAARGDTLVCLVRDIARAKRALPFPAECHAWRHDRAVPAAALAGVEAIVNLAGEPVAEGRWTAARKLLIRDTRVLGSRSLVQAAIAHGGDLKAFVQGSAIGCYGDRGDEVLTAESAAGQGFLADVVKAWEAEVRPLSEQRPAVRVPIVRTGVVLSRRGGALAKMLPVFRAHAGGRIGAGRHWMSWIHVEDIVGLLLHAIDSPVAGVLEGVAPQPATNAQFTTAFCRALGVMRNLPVPTLALRTLYGEMASVLLESARVEPRRTLESGYRFRFAAIDAALENLLAPLRGGTREKLVEQWLPRAPGEIWPFFCDERNLEAITPDFLRFRVIGKSTAAIGEGTMIDYRLRLGGVPMGWQSRIEEWEPPRQFVDTQVKGPYARWHHRHEFFPLAGGTLMRDTVHYRLPVGLVGSVVAGCPVESTVDRIFAYRSERIAERFGGGD